MSNKPLTERQRRFAAAYVERGNATQAAIQAGYAPTWAASQAIQLLNKTQVAAAIAERQAEIAARNAIKVDDVVRQLRHEMLTARDAHARIRAAELLGKHIGMWTRYERPEPRSPGLNPGEERLTLTVEAVRAFVPRVYRANGVGA